MKAGRELDAKVAETLGWKSTKLGNWYDEQLDQMKSLPYFSITWEGMGVLVRRNEKVKTWVQTTSSWQL
ncbi:hypothetical protein [Brevibacillus sp. DP1.3A]|uniref:hypothetical protein n=1 Tax=Brevibacillus sp. DP1.3A TaxID=2738867 RepID=UPI00156B021C|nr:hypothetical protein [Brevibacillus sp. DP1.3A]UED73455.1 hypothetical protein HP399_022380 [Brevibacillus sp. DP1.3A]